MRAPALEKYITIELRVIDGRTPSPITISLAMAPAYSDTPLEASELSSSSSASLDERTDWLSVGTRTDYISCCAITPDHDHIPLGAVAGATTRKRDFLDVMRLLSCLCRSGDRVHVEPAGQLIA